MIFDLVPDDELRVEVNFKKATLIRLISGRAEIFGTEIVPGQTYSFTSNILPSFAVYTWHGCSVEVDGFPGGDPYVSSGGATMTSYINLHAALDTRRQLAAATGKRGPRVIVTGQASVGKTTVSRLLVNYAARLGRKPLHIDLDTGDGSAGLPGTLSMAVLERMMDLAEGATGAASLCFHFGHPKPSDNKRLFSLLLDRMAELAQHRCGEDDGVMAGGYVIDTTALDKVGALEVQTAFGADVIAVIDDEKLYNSLVSTVPKGVTVIKLAKSGGVMPRDADIRRRERLEQVKRYFYGPVMAGVSMLHCYTFQVLFKDVKLYKIGAPPTPIHCLPIGADPVANETQLVAMKLQPDLLHTCFAVTTAPPDWKEREIELLGLPVAGFISIQEVNMDEYTVTMLSTVQYQHLLPSKPCTMLLSEQRYSDAAE